jgi:hypothetical protein
VSGVGWSLSLQSNLKDYLLYLIILPAMTEIISLSISRELREEIDHLQGDVARSKFISQAIETAIKSRGKKLIVTRG